MSAPAPWRRVPPDLATVVRGRLDTAVETVAGAVVATVPAFAAPDAKLARDLRTAVRTGLQRFAELVGSDEPALTPQVREVFVALGAAEAREDRGADALLAAFRAASRVMLRAASEALALERPVGTAEVLDLADAISAFVDELAAAGTDGYTRQLRELAGEGDRRRRLLGELLLRGTATRAAVDAAAAAVGWRAPSTVVPVLLPLDRARDARFRYGPDGLVVERDEDAVLLLREGPRSARPALAEGLHGRSAVVGPAMPWDRVPVAVRLAELAARQVGPPGPDGAAVFADDHLATLALHGDPGALDVLAGRRLAALSGLRDTERDRLVETLRSWLRHWGSRADVAAELFVHPQTVSYRVKRLRELLGPDLDEPTARFELLLVLSAGR